jgi:hypothetical protein
MEPAGQERGGLATARAGDEGDVQLLVPAAKVGESAHGIYSSRTSSKRRIGGWGEEEMQIGEIRLGLGGSLSPKRSGVAR